MGYTNIGPKYPREACLVRLLCTQVYNYIICMDQSHPLIGATGTFPITSSHWLFTSKFSIRLSVGAHCTTINCTTGAGLIARTFSSTILTSLYMPWFRTTSVHICMVFSYMLLSHAGSKLLTRTPCINTYIRVHRYFYTLKEFQVHLVSTSQTLPVCIHAVHTYTSRLGIEGKPTHRYWLDSTRQVGVVVYLSQSTTRVLGHLVMWSPPRKTLS